MPPPGFQQQPPGTIMGMRAPHPHQGIQKKLIVEEELLNNLI
jgi:hypothetical protein